MIRYGKKKEIKTTYVDWKEVDSHISYTERVAVKTNKDVLAEFIKLQNRQKAGEVYNIGIQTIEKPKGNLKFVELFYEVNQ